MAQLAAIGIATADMAESARFYRTLGVDVPEPSPTSRTWRRRCRTAFA